MVLLGIFAEILDFDVLGEGGIDGINYFADIVCHGHARHFVFSAWCCTRSEVKKKIKKLLLKAFMDDTAMAVSTEQHAYAMLFRLDEVVRWCSMDFKSEKSRSLSIMKGKPGTISFSVAKPHDPRGIRRTG